MRVRKRGHFGRQLNSFLANREWILLKLSQRLQGFSCVLSLPPDLEKASRAPGTHGLQRSIHRAGTQKSVGANFWTA